ncbi:PREDICTED: G-type lectin S-receptor-like serine/threonine-protein kinase At1g11300, partial [Brassica oleracea var. oleracea]|uniref:G-type lectin S-receptor-like serine/threonine-protein kinase At1g11300 n=1 Tax=Brassica oleracea var. oleracea TaxID=109376 RepID=UPI0006A73336
LAELLDSGNLVMKDSNTDAYLWESFEYPTDSWLPNMLVGTNAKTGGGNITITSWKTPSDPSPGSYTAALVLAAYPEIHIVNNNNKNATMWRSGPWNVTMSFANDSTLRHFYLDYKGSVIRRDWSEAKRNWTVGDQVPATECDVYRRCGQFPTCNPLKAPPCSCFKGFSPRNFVEWNSGNSSGGCIRKEPLQCERQNSNGSAADGFMRLRRVKLPDFARRSEASEPECLRTCLQTCSCVAFAHGLGYGCMTWNVSLVDSQDLSSSGMDLYIRLAHSEKPDRRPVIIGTSLASGVFVVAACGLLVQRIVKKRR